MNNLSETETKAFQLLRSGQVVDFSNGEKIDLTQAPRWGPERTLNSDFLRQLCIDPDKVKYLQVHGIRIRGGKIEGPLNLSALEIPFNISLRECFIPYPIDFRHSSVHELDLSGSRTVGIDADCLTVSGHMRIADGFRAEGPVSLLGATIKGDLTCVGGHFDNQSDQKDTTRITGCGDCRASTLHAYSLVLERAKIRGSLNLCGGFTAKGGVHLGDATVGVNLNCTKGVFTARTRDPHQEGKTSGRRLACEGDAEHHLACAFNGEGMHIKGNLILNGIIVEGETRLTGASIDGDLESADGKYINRGANAIHGDRLHVRGNIFFCNGFKAEGIVRLPRAEIGADLSFCNARLSNIPREAPLLHCEGIRVHGTVYLKIFKVVDGYVDLSYSTIGGNLDCTDSRFHGTGGWALKAKGMDIQGSVFLSSSGSGDFQAFGVVSLTGSKLGMDLICTDGQFKSDKRCEFENQTPCAIMTNNMSINGKVEMKGGNFIADGGVSLDDTNIGSFLDCDKGTFIVPPLGGNDNCSISAGKLHVDGSIYFGNGFKARGEVMLNDASIGRNFFLAKGTINNEGGYTLRAMQMKVAGSVNMKNFESHGEVRFDFASIGGNLDCSMGEFINSHEMNSGQEFSPGDGGERYALRANGVKIEGRAEFKNGFHADGIVSLRNAHMGIGLSWMQIRNPAKASLHLNSAKVGVLEDEENSWPDRNMLQINGFEYRFLKELTAEGLKSRREKWLQLPPDFRTQPFEQLSAVLRRNGYEEDAKKVLIKKNKMQTRLPVRWPWSNVLDRRCPPRDGCRQSQSVITWIFRKLFGALVCYGYKPGRALWYGLIFVLVGWALFYQGFKKEIMVPTKGKGRIYQTAKIDQASTDTDLRKLVEGEGFYSLVYSVDTFLPIIDLQTADYWLPTAHPPRPAYMGWGFWLCIYRWVLIISGWVISSFFIAALTGIVRR